MADDNKVMIGLTNKLVVAVAMACILAAPPTGGTRLVCHCSRGMFQVWGERCTGVGVVISIVTNGREVVNTYRKIPISFGRCGQNIDRYEVEYGHRDWSVNAGSQKHTLCTIYSFKNYPAVESPVVSDPLLSAPFPFTMTDSGRFLRSSGMIQWLSTHTKQMIAGNNASKTQQGQLLTAADKLQSRENVWLTHGSLTDLLPEDPAQVATTVADGCKVDPACLR